MKMKHIACPYDWDCGKKFNINSLSSNDLEFIELATKKKMRMMFLHCPKCTRTFSFDTVLWKASASHAINPNKKVDTKAEKPIKELTDILAKNRITIPSLYFEYLTSNCFNPNLAIFNDEDDFQLYSLSELCEEINIDKRKMLQINELWGFSQSIIEANQDFFNAKEKEQYEELATCLSIGYQNNKVLYMDNKNNNSLFVFYIDDASTKKIKKITLQDITKRTGNR